MIVVRNRCLDYLLHEIKFSFKISFFEMMIISSIEEFLFELNIWYYI